MFKILLICIFFPVFSFGQMASIELDVKPLPEPVIRDMTVEQWNLSQSHFKDLSAKSQDFLYWINLCRNNPSRFWDSVVVPAIHCFPQLNGPEAKSLRAELLLSGPLPMFSVSSALVQTAQFHATDISNKLSHPGHNSTDGTDFGTRMKRAGIKYCANENIAISSQSTLLAVLLLYLDIGLPEKGHRKSLLNPMLVETGIGSSKYGKDQHFFVQDLSCAQQ